MATAGGPNIGKDGLVFGYDTGYGVADNSTTTRHYKGAPTINYIHGWNAVPQDSYTAYSATSSGNWNSNHPNAIRAYNAQGGDITGYYNSGVGNAANTHHGYWQYDEILKKPVVVMNDVAAQWKAKSFPTGLGTWTSQGKTHGDTYTISWLQWVNNLSKNAKAGLYTKDSASSNGFHDGQANSASSYNTKLNTWQRVYQTYTTNASRDLNNAQASIYMYGHYNVRATVKIADVQFTWGSIPFPFSAENERTSTQSLIDLKKTTDIDLSNVSFDSTGQPDFDGTDDKIDLGGSSQFNIQRLITIESVVKRDSSGWNGIFGTTSGGNFIHWQLSGSGLNCYFYGPGVAITKDNQVTDTSKFYHLVVTFDGTNARLYNNGVQVNHVTTASTANINSTSATSIGQVYSTDRMFDGKIPIVKVYNQALSANEVKQNFNAYKNRFDL